MEEAAYIFPDPFESQSDAGSGHVEVMGDEDIESDDETKITIAGKTFDMGFLKPQNL